MTYATFPIGSKVQTYDSYGYYIIPLCGIIETHLGEGHAIIKSFDGSFYSTIGYGKKVADIEVLK